MFVPARLPARHVMAARSARPVPAPAAKAAKLTGLYIAVVGDRGRVSPKRPKLGSSPI